MTSSYQSRTTSSTAPSGGNNAAEDMPQWKKNMLDRQKKEEEAKTNYSSRYEDFCDQISSVLKSSRTVLVLA